MPNRENQAENRPVMAELTLRRDPCSLSFANLVNFSKPGGMRNRLITATFKKWLQHRLIQFNQFTAIMSISLTSYLILLILFYLIQFQFSSICRVSMATSQTRVLFNKTFRKMFSKQID